MRAIVLACVACHPTTTLVPPPTGEGRSLLFIATSDEGLEFVQAIDLPEGGPPIYPTFSRPEEVDLYAVELSCPLDVLGLEPGRLGIRESPAARVELPEPLSIVTSHDGQEQSPWTEVEIDAADDLLRSVDLPAQNLCRLYGVQFAPQEEPFFVGTATLTHVMRLTEETALVMSSSGLFYRVDADRNVEELTHLSTTTPNRAGFIGDDNTYYLISADGSVARGRPLDDLEIIHTGGATVAEFSVASGAPNGAEIFRASFAGPLERFDGSAWTQLTSGGARFEHGTYDVAWTEEGTFAIGVLEDRLIVRYFEGRLTVEEPAGEIPDSIEYVPGIGLLVGTDRGRILRRVNDTWIIDEASSNDGDIRAIVPTERGFIYGRSRFGSWDPVSGYCPLEVQGNRNVRIVSLGRKGILVASIGDRFGGQSSVSIYRRTDETHLCLGK